MKNHIPTFSRFINEGIDDLMHQHREDTNNSNSQNRNRDKMVYLVPRSYRIKVKLSPEYIGTENQSKSEMMLTTKLSKYSSDKTKFHKHQGVNIIGDNALFRLESVFTEDDIQSFIEVVFRGAIDGKINIEETDENDKGGYSW